MRTYVKDNIKIVEVENKEEGAKIAFELLKREVTRKTILFLSGGNSLRQLYRMIVSDKSKQINPGAVATVDERWGSPGHKNSNEKMIDQTGLYEYFKKQGVEIHKILHGILNRSETAKRYNIVLEGLLERFSKSVAIVSIGKDGHTAGLAPSRAGWENPAFDKKNKDRLVIDFDNQESKWNFAERITVTPFLLKSLDNIILLVFGFDKREALLSLFSKEGKDENFPARIYLVLKGKVTLISDIQL